MLKTLRKRLIHWIAKELLPVIDEGDVLMFDKQHKMFINGEQLTPQEVQNLRSEVRFLEESRVWKLMNGYFDTLAKKKMYMEAMNEEAILFTKTMLYTLNVQQTIVKNIKNLKD